MEPESNFSTDSLNLTRNLLIVIHILDKGKFSTQQKSCFRAHTNCLESMIFFEFSDLSAFQMPNIIADTLTISRVRF